MAAWTLERCKALMADALDRHLPENDRLDLIREILQMLNPIIGAD